MKAPYDYVQECIEAVLHEPEYRKRVRRVLRKLVRDTIRRSDEILNELGVVGADELRPIAKELIP